MGVDAALRRLLVRLAGSVESEWEFEAESAGSPELVTILPVAVMGPIMGTDVSGGNHLVQSILSGSMAALPDLYIPIVDVRDVASAHILAMTTPEAVGERFLLSNGAALSMPEIGETIRTAVGEAGPNVMKRTVPSFVVRIGSLFNKEFRPFVPDLGYSKRTSNEKARRVLGWTPRDPHKAVTAAAQSLVAATLD